MGEAMVRDRGHRRPVLLVLATVVLVAIVVTAVVALVGLPKDAASRPPRAFGTSFSPPPPPARGLQRVTFHALAIDVPASWPVNATPCGTAAADTVILPGMVGGCAGGRRMGVTSAQFEASSGNASKQPGGHTATVRVSGEPATRTTRRSSGDAVVVVAVPAARAVVTITSPSAAHAARLAATLRVVSRDSNGCDVEFMYRTLADTPKPRRAGVSGALVPGAPTGLVMCEYGDGLLQHGETVPRSHLSDLVAKLNSLPTGTSRTRAGTASCSPSQPPSEALDAGAPGGFEFVFRVRYSSGPPLLVVARLGFCGDLGASNGARTVQRTTPLTNLVTLLPGFDIGYPEFVYPAP